MLCLEYWMVMFCELEKLSFTDIFAIMCRALILYLVCSVVKYWLCCRLKDSAGVMHQNLPYPILQTLASGYDFVPSCAFCFAPLNFPSPSFLTHLSVSYQLLLIASVCFCNVG